MNRTQQFITGMTLLGIALLILTGLPALAQGGGVAQLIGGTEASLREFILRTEGLLAAVDNDVTIRIESLPDDMPVELPLPDDARPVGSIAVAWPEGGSYRLLVDTSLEPAAVLDFYADALTASPWRRLSLPGMAAVSGTMATDMYCHGPDISVNINAWRLPAGTTDLQIYVNADSGAVLCGGHPDALPPLGPALLPDLPDLPGVVAEGISEFNISPDVALLAGTLHTDGSLDALFAAYNAALEDSGWTQVRSERGTGVAWSSWTLADPEGLAWEGSLILSTSAAGPDRYQVQVRLSRLPVE